MTEHWPPPGHSFTYRMDVNLEVPRLSYSAEVSVVARPNGGENDIAAFRYERLGGTNGADLDFRSQLYPRIGAVTVAGGHAEAAMKRVILSAEEDGGSFRDVDLSWTALVKRLHRLAESDHVIAEPLSRVLSWAERRSIKKRRDDVVHSYWWHWAGVGVSRSRFTRDGQSYIVVGTLDQLEQLDRDAALIFEYARRLDELVESIWPQARLLEQGREILNGIEPETVAPLIGSVKLPTK
ncbi:MAG: hypothetical protein EOL91_07535 [Actinobacteria bacterium]|nr:hypothetical protein [Actinomycetota bacterium]